MDLLYLVELVLVPYLLCQHHHQHLPTVGYDQLSQLRLGQKTELLSLVYVSTMWWHYVLHLLNMHVQGPTSWLEKGQKRLELGCVMLWCILLCCPALCYILLEKKKDNNKNERLFRLTGWTLTFCTSWNIDINWQLNSSIKYDHN